MKNILKAVQIGQAVFALVGEVRAAKRDGKITRPERLRLYGKLAEILAIAGLDLNDLNPDVD